MITAIAQASESHLRIGGLDIVSVLIYAVVAIAMIGISIYCFILFIKLARRGIKALDIYNSKNNRGEK